MAVFNPQIQPTNDPNWLGWSKPITQPGGDKSTGIALGEIGENLAAGLKLADTATKSVIEDQVYTAAKAEQTRFTTDLQNADDAIRLAQTSKANTATATDAAPLNLLNAQTGPSMPGDLKNLPVMVDSLGNARANGKIDPTPYYARLDALAKDFRARYPGYREYVDEVMQKASGVDPANKYIQSVTADINSFATNLNSERNKVISWATNHEVLGLPGMQNKLNEFLAGKATAQDVYNAAAPGLQQKYTFENNRRIVDDIEGNEKLKKLYANKAITVDAATTVANHIDTLVIQGAGGPQKVTDWINANGPGKGTNVPDPQWATLGQIIEQDMVSVSSELRKKYNAPGPAGQPSYAQVMGGQDAVNKVIEDNLKWHRMQLEAIQKKDTGLMFSAAMMTKAESDGMLRNIVKDYPTVGLMKTFNDINPQWASTMYSSIIGSTLKTPDKTGLIGIAVQAGKQPQLTLIPGMPAPTPNPATGQVEPYTMTKALDSTKPDPSSPVVTPGSPQLTKEITRLPNKIITDPKAPDEIKLNFAKFAFDPTNDNFINKIEGIGNKYSVFTDMTAPAVTKELKRLSTVSADGAKGWNDYKRWVGNEFGNQLFNKEILSLNSMQEMDGVKIVWNNKNYRFDVDIPRTQEMDPMRPGKYPTPDQARYVKATINRLNDGLGSVAEVYKADNKDPNAYVLGLLKGQGYQPGFSNLGIQMQQSVISSHAKPDEKGLLKGRELPYNETNAPPSGSLGDFISNPPGRFTPPAARVVPNSRNNAPAAFSGPPRGILRGTSTAVKQGGNLSGEDLLSVSTSGASNEDFSKINPNYGR